MKRTNNFHISFFHIFGVVIIFTGIFLMWSAYNGARQKKLAPTENIGSAEADEDIEGIMESYSAVKSRSDTAMRMSMAIIGGLCILGGIPVFYVSHADTIHKLPKRKKHDTKQEPEETEFDFDYDNFDFDGYYTLDEEKFADIEINESVMDIIKRNYKKDDENDILNKRQSDIKF